MSWIIDGHNLIPYIPGLQLNALDDEIRLVELLQNYSRVRRKAVEVFFDGAPAGQTGTRRYGTIRAHFIRLGRTADEAIVHRLHQLGPSAQNSTVVTSDRRVKAEAAGLRVPVISSEAFARDLIAANQEGSARSGAAEPILSGADVEEWLKLFKQKPKE